MEAGSQALRRVIQNLIKNGMDHGEKKIHIALERQDDRAVMTFANQVACPEKIDTEHVFDRFYKADEARSRTSTGLGLSIARELVLRMKGTITARMEGTGLWRRCSFLRCQLKRTKIQRAPEKKMKKRG